MKIAYTRAMIRAALSGALDTVAVRTRPAVQPRGADELSRTCRPASSNRAAPGATARRTTQQAAKLARLFAENFKAFEAGVTAEVRAAGPKA